MIVGISSQCFLIRIRAPTQEQILFILCKNVLKIWAFLKALLLNLKRRQIPINNLPMKEKECRVLSKHKLIWEVHPIRS